MLIQLMQTAGRKFSWAYAALFALWSANMLGHLSGGEFVMALGALATTVMAANSYEHKAKNGAAAPAP